MQWLGSFGETYNASVLVLAVDVVALKLQRVSSLVEYNILNDTVVDEQSCETAEDSRNQVSDHLSKQCEAVSTCQLSLLTLLLRNL